MTTYRTLLATAVLAAALTACQTAGPPAPPPPDGDPLLAAPAHHDAGAGAHSVLAVDLDGDGNLDLVAAVSGDDAVAVLLGLGDRAFAAPVLLPTGAQPKHVAVADVDGSGQLDIVVANDAAADGEQVSVIRRTPEGGFMAAEHYAACPNPHQIAIGDFDGDGVADLAVVCWSDDDVSVLFGVGDGTFAPHVTVPSGSEALHAVVAADLDGDGVDDLAVAGLGTSTVSVLVSNGDGTFAPAVTYGVGSSPHGLAVGDLTGSGHADLVTANQGSHDVSVLINGGDGTFARTDVAAGPVPKDVAIGDLDGDGVPDIVTANSHGNYPGGGAATSISVLYGLGSGTFSAPEHVAVDLTPFGVDVGDVDGDGLLDVVTANWGSGDLAVLYNTGGDPAPGTGP